MIHPVSRLLRIKETKNVIEVRLEETPTLREARGNLDVIVLVSERFWYRYVRHHYDGHLCVPFTTAIQLEGVGMNTLVMQADRILTISD